MKQKCMLLCLVLNPILALKMQSQSLVHTTPYANYQYYRLNVIKSQATEQYYCLRELSFLGTDGQAISLDSSYGSAQSEFNANHDAAVAFDANLGSFYCSGNHRGAGSGGWLQYNFQTPTTVANYEINSLSGYGNTHNIKSWTFEGTNDPSGDWEKLDERLDQAAWANAETRKFSVQSAAGGGKAGGDPHVQNVKGERFNIVRQGYAPLVSITSSSSKILEVMALIEGVKKCQKKMFITLVNASGSWLEKNVAVEVATGPDSNQAFSVTVDGQEVWSPVLQGYAPPSTENTVFKHADKFSIHEVSAKSSLVAQPGIELNTAHDVKMKIVRPLHRPTAPPHLNFDIQGLINLPLPLKVGGLLGHDDHAYWSARDQNCGVDFERSESAEGSIASAH